MGRRESLNRHVGMIDQHQGLKFRQLSDLRNLNEILQILCQQFVPLFHKLMAFAQSQRLFAQSQRAQAQLGETILDQLFGWIGRKRYAWELESQGFVELFES